MNLEIKPINNSTIDLGLVLSTSIFNLELQDWHLIELVINDEQILQFEPSGEQNAMNDGGLLETSSHSLAGFIDLWSIQPLMISIQ